MDEEWSAYLGSGRSYLPKDEDGGQTASHVDDRCVCSIDTDSLPVCCGPSLGPWTDNTHFCGERIATSNLQLTRDGQPPISLMAGEIGHQTKSALVADGAEKITFIVDSGSSHHIFRGRKDLMENYVNISTSVSTANNVNGLRAVGHGTLPVYVDDLEGNEVRVDLTHVLHAPLCTHNLLSVARFTEMKMHVEFVGDTCTLHTPAGEKFEASRPEFV